jgi:hypothetical protein
MLDRDVRWLESCVFDGVLIAFDLEKNLVVAA